MSEAVLDTMVLQALGFGHPDGLAILFASIDAARPYIPAEVYNQDEDVLHIDRADRGVSEFGRGLRFARRRVVELPAIEAARYQHWLLNAQQIAWHIRDGKLVVTVLDLEETRQREELITRFGIGLGEEACLVVAHRCNQAALFVSSDDAACRVAREIGVSHTTLVDVLEQWIARTKPPLVAFEELVTGMAMARFQLSDLVLERLRKQLREAEH